MRNWLLLAGGALIAALGLNGFVVSNQLTEGGVTGISVLVHYFSHVPVGLLYALLNLPLLAAGWFVLGRQFVLKTVAGIAFLSLALLLTARIQFAMPDLLLASLYGGGFSGLGLGLMFRSGGSSGGLDIVAIYLKRRYGLPIGETFLILDALILSLAGLLLGANTALYSLVITFISGRIIDYVQEGPNRAKAALIITNESKAVSELIMREFERGVTIIDGEGAYTGLGRKVVFTVLSRRELTQLKVSVHAVDPEAFIVIHEVAEVLGEGFSRQATDPAGQQTRSGQPGGRNSPTRYRTRPRP